MYTSIKPNPKHAEWNLSFIVLGYFKCQWANNEKETKFVYFIGFFNLKNQNVLGLSPILKPSNFCSKLSQNVYFFCVETRLKN